IVGSLLLFVIDFVLLGYVLDVFERRPDPLPAADRLVADVEPDEPERLAQTGWLGRLVLVTRHQHQSVDGVKFCLSAAESRAFHDTLSITAPGSPGGLFASAGAPGCLFAPAGKSTFNEALSLLCCPTLL